ncbi:MAG: cytochrome c oxidase subunit 4 [Actinomycetes bacterium]
MKTETSIFAGLVFFFVPVGLIYGWLTDWQEHVGYLALILTAGLCGLIAAYLWMTSRRIDERPEDDPQGEVEENAGELGFFSPYSWWPLPLAIGGALIFLAVAVGWWILVLGIPLSAVSLVGWVYEYYRGAHAH